MKIKESELILNTDGSVYHLHLKPQDIAQTIITVGDSERVTAITKYFDHIELTKQNREFKTQTGTCNGKRITVLSTGIGTDNIDIVLNELDALVNIDLETRKIKKELQSLDIIRIGTSGAINPEIPLDSFLLSKIAIGFDSMLYFYKNENVEDIDASNAFIKHTNWFSKKSMPYFINCSKPLSDTFISNAVHLGITATNVGFYGPQGRVLRLALQDTEINSKLATFTYNNLHITNMEMETAGIYALSKMLGHNAVSLNAILASRVNGSFSKNPEKTIDALINYTIEKLVS